MDLAAVLVFVAGLTVTPLVVGLWILWTERNNRRFRKAKTFINKAGYEVVGKNDPRIQPWHEPSRAPEGSVSWLTEKY